MHRFPLHWPAPPLSPRMYNMKTQTQPQPQPPPPPINIFFLTNERCRASRGPGGVHHSIYDSTQHTCTKSLATLNQPNPVRYLIFGNTEPTQPLPPPFRMPQNSSTTPKQKPQSRLIILTNSFQGYTSWVSSSSYLITSAASYTTTTTSTKLVKRTPLECSQLVMNPQPDAWVEY